MTTEPLSDADLDAIEARLRAATPGPWHLSDDRDTITQTSHITRDVWTIPRTHEDMEFIAHAPEDIAFLLARVREMEAEIAACVATRAVGSPVREAEPAPVIHHEPTTWGTALGPTRPEIAAEARGYASGIEAAAALLHRRAVSVRKVADEPMIGAKDRDEAETTWAALTVAAAGIRALLTPPAGGKENP